MRAMMESAEKAFNTHYYKYVQVSNRKQKHSEEKKLYLKRMKCVVKIFYFVKNVKKLVFKHL